MKANIDGQVTKKQTHDIPNFKDIRKISEGAVNIEHSFAKKKASRDDHHKALGFEHTFLKPNESTSNSGKH